MYDSLTPPAPATDMKPEPRTSAGPVNLISWLAPASSSPVVVQICISRVSECPLAAVMVIVSFAMVVSGAAWSAMASITSWPVEKRCATAKGDSSNTAVRTNTKRLSSALNMWGDLLRSGEGGSADPAQEHQARSRQDYQRDDPYRDDGESHQRTERADRHELAEDQSAEAGAQCQGREEDRAPGGEDGLGHGRLGRVTFSQLLHVTHRQVDGVISHSDSQRAQEHGGEVERHAEVTKNAVLDDDGQQQHHDGDKRCRDRAHQAIDDYHQQHCQRQADEEVVQQRVLDGQLHHRRACERVLELAVQGLGGDGVDLVDEAALVFGRAGGYR